MRIIGSDKQNPERPLELEVIPRRAPASQQSSGHRAFMLRAHLGEFALWLSGLFPDHITARRSRRGAPGIAYYEELGSNGFRLAARYTDAEVHGMDRVYRSCADTFPALRIALNRIADRHLFPVRGDRIERMLRQLSDDFGTRPTDGLS
jgi:hypothetical protein